MSKNSLMNKLSKTEKRKRPNLIEVDRIKNYRLPHSNNPVTHVEQSSDVHANDPVKKKKVALPDPKIQRSKTKTKEVRKKGQPKDVPSKVSNRYTEDTLIPTTSKKLKTNDPSEIINTTVSYDCMIIECPKTRVEIEVVDLTEDSGPKSSELRYPLKIKDLKSISCKRNARNYVMSENDCEVNKNKSSIDIHKNIDSFNNSPSCILVKTETSKPGKSINKVNHDQLPAKLYTNQVRITAEKRNSRENNAQINLGNSNVISSQYANSKINNISIRSEHFQENANSEVADQTRVFADIAKDPSHNMTPILQLSDVPLKVEQNGNFASGNSLSVPNLSFKINPRGFSSTDCRIKSESSETNKNCELSDSYLSISNPFSDASCKLGRSMVIKKQTFQSVSSTTDCVDNSDLRLYEQGTFPTPLIKYLNCNMRVNVLEIAYTVSALNSILEKEGVIGNCDNTIEIDTTLNSANSQENLISCLNIKREELLNPTIKRKKFARADKTLDNLTCSSLKEIINSIPNVSSVVFNSISPRLEKSINERQEQNLFINNDLNNERDRMKKSSPCPSFHSSANTMNILDNSNPTTVSPLSLDDNKLRKTSNNLKREDKKNPSKISSHNFPHKISSKAKATGNSDDTGDSSNAFKSSVEKIVNSEINIDKSVYENLRQIKMVENRNVENMNPTSEKNGKNSENTIESSKNFAKSLPIPSDNVFKHGVFFDTLATENDAFGTPSKKVKLSKYESIYQSNDVKKLSYPKYKRGASLPVSSQDHPVAEHALDIQPNLPNVSTGSLNCEPDLPTTPEYGQIPSVFSEPFLQNLSFTPTVNANYSHNLDSTPCCFPMMLRNVDSQEQLDVLNINHMYSTQNVPETTKSYDYPFVKQAQAASIIDATKNQFSVQTSTESFLPPVVSKKIQQVNQMISEINSFYTLNFNPVTSEKDCQVTQHNPHQSVQRMKCDQPFLSLAHLPGNVPSNQYLESQKNYNRISGYAALYYDQYPSENFHHKIILNPPLPDSSPPPLPPLPSTSPGAELTHSIAPKNPKSSLLRDLRKLVTLKSSLSNFIFKSLLPKQLRKDIGRDIIHTNDLYLIIIERSFDWIHAIDKQIEEFMLVRNRYENHLAHYNTYFPLLLLDCFSKISAALKVAKREKLDKNICKIVHCETKQSYVFFTCESFIRHADVESIPKDGHVILVKFATLPVGGVKMLGFVCSSATRVYSHRHDHMHEILKSINVNKPSELIKIKISFYIVFAVSGLNLNLPIEISKLASLKKALMLNEALKELQRSPLCNTILNPRSDNFKSFTLPRRQDSNNMTIIVQKIVQSLNSLTPKMIGVESPPSSDSFLAIVQILEEIQKKRMSGKVLVCVRMEMLSQMGINLVETSRNVVIINRERENISEKLQNRVLDVMASHLSKTRNLPDDDAKCKVLQEADVLLVVTGTCFYGDVQSMMRDLTYCIIHDAHSFTEPESLLPLLYGIRHLLLFGYHEETCHVSSNRAVSLGYKKSLFHRAYKLC